MLNETFSVIFQHLNCILVSTLARWDDQRDDVNQQAWEQPRKKSSQIYENYTAMLLLLNWKVSVKMPACQRLSKITSWKSLWWIARKRFPISSSCCSWQPEEHESFNFFFQSTLSYIFRVEWMDLSTARHLGKRPETFRYSRSLIFFFLFQWLIWGQWFENYSKCRVWIFVRLN